MTGDAPAAAAGLLVALGMVALMVFAPASGAATTLDRPASSPADEVPAVGVEHSPPQPAVDDAIGATAPDAEFEYSPSDPVVDETVTFDASNSSDPEGDIVEYRWDFDGDDTFDVVTNNSTATHAFGESGTYPVLLVTENQFGTTDSAVRNVTVEPSGPTARCSVSTESASVGEGVIIDASDSENAASYEFDVDGDGTFDTDRISQAYINHSYDEPGEYTPRVRAHMEVESDTAECGTVEVVGENEPPEATFTWDPDPAVAGNETTLDASNSTDPDGNISLYRWDFDGDGVVDRNTTVPVTFYEFSYNETGPGYAVVELTVVDDQGESGTYGRDIDIVRAPTARCSVFPETASVGEGVLIDASDSENAATYEYDLDGDGTFDTDRLTRTFINHSYEEPGEYTPRVRAYMEDRTDTAECGPVRVEGENEPPKATFTWNPDPAVAGEETTLDASGSTDPDGSIVEYRWDFDGDGIVDEVTADPVTTYEFAYDETGQGYAVVELTVVDDEGTTGIAGNDVEIVAPPTARCSVFPETAPIGEEVTIDASDSENAGSFEYDLDGDGTFDTDRLTRATITHAYEEPGEYTPRVLAYGDSSEETDVAECGPITVGGGNEPPVATFDYEPEGPSTDDQVTFNASASMDPDGSIEKYRWDFDGDGEVDEVTDGPVVTHSFDSAGSDPVGLVVVDDDGETDSNEQVVEVESPGGSGLPGPDWLIPGAIAGGGAGAGYVAGRRRCSDLLMGGGKSSTSGGIAAHATGTFQTPRGSETVAVEGLGFEPDLLVFTATNNVTADGRTMDRTDGWTYGKAKLDDEGVTQNVVSVADDARRADAGAAVSRADAAVDLLVHDDENANGLLGSVESTTQDGFEMRFDASALPDGRADERYVVMFQAFATAQDADVDVGYFLTPGEAAVQTVELGTDADYVRLTANETLTEMHRTAVTGSRLGVSHGVAAQEDSVRQHAINSAVESSSTGRNSYAAFDDRAIHLLHGDGDGIDGRTSARVTGLGEHMQLTYDEVYAPDGGTGAAGPSGTQTAAGQRGAQTDATAPNGAGATGDEHAGADALAPPRLVTYVAVDTGDGAAPGVGHFELPTPEEGPKRVDVGFESSVLEFTASTADGVGTERTVATNPLSFGWSHGTAMIDRSGTVHHDLLHSSLDADEVSASGPVETPLTRAPTSDPTQGAAASPDGGVPAGQGAAQLPGDAGACAVAFTLDDDGRVLGREDVRVTGVDRTGFEVETERLGPDGRGENERPPVVFYTAWAGEGGK